MERLRQNKFYMVDQGIIDDALQPFALEEVMMRRAGETAKPAVHIWRHRHAFVAGLRDRRLPYAEQALQELRTDCGFDAIVRNSGGAAVPLHAGVVNVSVILPKPKGTLDIYDDFAWMADFLSAVLEPVGVAFDQGEVIGSYCPGEYDLSIGGRKFCGIAQRRQLHAYSLQAFVIVEGEGADTGAVARRFYERATGGRTDLGAPQVEPSTMASLQQLTGSMTVERFLQALRDRLHEWGALDGRDLPARYEPEIRSQIQLMRERYDR